MSVQDSDARRIPTSGRAGRGWQGELIVGRGQVCISRWMQVRLGGMFVQQLQTSSCGRAIEETALLLCCHVLSPAFLQASSSLALQIHTLKPLISLP